MAERLKKGQTAGGNSYLKNGQHQRHGSVDENNNSLIVGNVIQSTNDSRVEEMLPNV
jgi:hypothetical protein